MWSERANPGRRESSGRVERMSVTITGGCHCGLVHFEADLPSPDAEVLECNCSICAATGYLHLIVPESAFRLIDGRTETTTYRFGSGKAKHLFCSTCGKIGRAHV